MDNKELDAAVDYLQKNQLRVVTAESCTGGMIASTLAEPAGSGKWLECAFVTYSEDAKIECLNVEQQLIDRHGLTSEEVARAMAEGALASANANLAIATTGVAGPSAGDGDVPVGTVCFAWAFKSGDGVLTFCSTSHFDGDRHAVREAATRCALRQIAPLHRPLKRAQEG